MRFFAFVRSNCVGSKYLKNVRNNLYHTTKIESSDLTFEKRNSINLNLISGSQVLTNPSFLNCTWRNPLLLGRYNSNHRDDYDNSPICSYLKVKTFGE